MRDMGKRLATVTNDDGHHWANFLTLVPFTGRSPLRVAVFAMLRTSLPGRLHGDVPRLVDHILCRLPMVRHTHKHLGDSLPRESEQITSEVGLVAADVIAIGYADDQSLRGTERPQGESGDYAAWLAAATIIVAAATLDAGGPAIPCGFFGGDSSTLNSECPQMTIGRALNRS